MVDLTGTTSTPQPLGGQIAVSGSTLSLDAPLQLAFQLSDPGSGTTANLNVQGTLEADYTAPAPTSYCSSVPNSSGAAGVIQASGSQSLFASSLTLDATNLPTLSLGYFIFSESQGFATGLGGGQGNLCLSTNHGRFSQQVMASGHFGTFTILTDTTGFPTTAGGSVAVIPGETWYFQAWHRDLVGGAATTNFTDGLEVTFQ